jgi:DNA-binding NtrC family response regulator
MDGLEVIRELHGVRPGLPLIAISGYDPKDESGYLSLAEEYGALKSFSKPFDRDEVLEAVKEMLEK